MTFGIGFRSLRAVSSVFWGIPRCNASFLSAASQVVKRGWWPSAIEIDGAAEIRTSMTTVTNGRRTIWSRGVIVVMDAIVVLLGCLVSYNWFYGLVHKDHAKSKNFIICSYFKYIKDQPPKIDFEILGNKGYRSGKKVPL